MAPACRDAKSCVSRPTYSDTRKQHIANNKSIYPLVRRKILRLYFSMPACDIMPFPTFITMASACRDAKSCVSRPAYSDTRKQHIANNKSIYPLVRRKILRLYF